mmetsp:Transcript_29216/g.76700  ORF Transcript_29216/g.76700 Transcript_29216/m.76700 type:complete len:257 (+) Transcript_29216:284-1054(+)
MPWSRLSRLRTAARPASVLGSLGDAAPMLSFRMEQICRAVWPAQEPQSREDISCSAAMSSSRRPSNLKAWSRSAASPRTAAAAIHGRLHRNGVSSAPKTTVTTSGCPSGPGTTPQSPSRRHSSTQPASHEAKASAATSRASHRGLHITTDPVLHHAMMLMAGISACSHERETTYPSRARIWTHPMKMRPHPMTLRVTDSRATSAESEAMTNTRPNATLESGIMMSGRVGRKLRSTPDGPMVIGSPSSKCIPLTPIR